MGSIKLNPEDDARIERICKATGINAAAEAVRVALKAYETSYLPNIERLAFEAVKAETRKAVEARE